MSERHPACAADGCYLFAPGTPERAACEAACRMRERYGTRTRRPSATAEEGTVLRGVRLRSGAAEEG